MSSRDVYGRLLAAPTVERGVEVTLRYYLSRYLGEVLAQNGHDRRDLPDPTDLARVSEFPPRGPDLQTALVVVVATPGTLGDARMEAEHYSASFDVRAAVLADLGKRLESREAAQFYAAAAGAALAHQGVAQVAADLRTWQRDEHGDLANLEGSTVQWVGERYVELPRMPGVLAGEARVIVRVEGARSTAPFEEIPPDEPTDPREPPVESGSASVVPSLTISRDPVEDF